MRLRVALVLGLPILVLGGCGRGIDLSRLPAFYGGGRDYRVDPYLTAARHLQEIGQADASNVLMNAHTEQVFVLCRMLFTARKGGEFRRPHIGEPIFIGDSVIADRPLEPIELVDGVPFLVTTGYTLAGVPEQPAQYVKECMEHCDWNPHRYGEMTAAQKGSALARLIASSKWKKPLDADDRNFLAAQIR